MNINTEVNRLIEEMIGRLLKLDTLIYIPRVTTIRRAKNSQGAKLDFF